MRAGKSSSKDMKRTMGHILRPHPKLTKLSGNLKHRTHKSSAIPGRVDQGFMSGNPANPGDFSEHN